MHVQLLVHAFLIFFLACVGLRWPLWVFVGLCWPALGPFVGFCGSLWACIGLHGLSQLVSMQKKKKRKNIPTLHLEPYTPFHALVGLHQPLLTFVGLHWAFVGLHGSLWACIGLHGLAQLVSMQRKKKKKKRKKHTYITSQALCTLPCPCRPALALIGCCGPSLTFVGLHWAFVDLCGSSWACIGLHWVFVGLCGPALACMAFRSQLVCRKEKRKKKKGKNIPTIASRALHTLLCPPGPALALIWLALACIGCCSLSMLVVKAVGIWYMQKIVSILLLILNYSDVSQITSIKKGNLPNTPHST